VRASVLFKLSVLFGLKRAGQPAAMAGDALRVIMDMGKFQGVTAYTTPTGSLITTNFLSLLGACGRRAKGTRLSAWAGYWMGVRV